MVYTKPVVSADDSGGHQIIIAKQPTTINGITDNKPLEIELMYLFLAILFAIGSTLTSMNCVNLSINPLMLEIKNL